MKKTLLSLAAIMVIFGITGCGKVPTLKNGKEVVAQVEGKKITADELYQKLKSQGGEATLVNLIDEFILNKEIETDEDAKTYANSQIESYKTSYKSYGQDFEEALKNAGYKNEDAFKESLILEYKKQEITKKYIKGQITDSEIEKYYEDKIFGDIEAKHILISPDVKENATDEEKEEAENKAKEKANELIKKLDEGANFEDLAKENSDDKGTASKGGKLTVVYGEVVDEFWDATYKLKNKTYTKSPVKSEYGYHIIYRISAKDKPKLNAVKDDVIDKLVEEKMAEDQNAATKAMIDLRKKYKLDIIDSDIKESYNTSTKEALKEK